MKACVGLLCLALFVASTQAFLLGMDGSDFMAYSFMTGGNPFQSMFGGGRRFGQGTGAATPQATGAGAQQRGGMGMGMPFGNNWLGLAYLTDGM